MLGLPLAPPSLASEQPSLAQSVKPRQCPGHPWHWRGRSLTGNLAHSHTPPRSLSGGAGAEPLAPPCLVAWTNPWVSEHSLAQGGALRQSPQPIDYIRRPLMCHFYLAIREGRCGAVVRGRIVGTRMNTEHARGCEGSGGARPCGPGAMGYTNNGSSRGFGGAQLCKVREVEEGCVTVSMRVHMQVQQEGGVHGCASREGWWTYACAQGRQQQWHGGSL
ncbi:hypothetical protein BC827DRAFT_326491 [Russula dissimulans]|nr:hypothetical protein BC827DRAFT_326491 [Russula dissimulans]